MVRAFKYHEHKLLKKVDFMDWKSDGKQKAAMVMSRFYINKREEYVKYMRICGHVTSFVAKIRKLDPKDPFRLKLATRLLNKLYDMGIVSSKSSLSVCDKLSVSSFCRRRLPVVMVRNKMVEMGPSTAVDSYAAFARLVSIGTPADDFGGAGRLLLPIIGAARTAASAVELAPKELADCLRRVLRDGVAPGLLAGPGASVERLLPFAYLLVKNNVTLRNTVASQELLHGLTAAEAAAKLRRERVHLGGGSRRGRGRGGRGNDRYRGPRNGVQGHAVYTVIAPDGVEPTIDPRLEAEINARKRFLLEARPSPNRPAESVVGENASAGFLLAEFGIGLVDAVLGAPGKLDWTSRKQRAMLDPFVALLADCLNDTHASVANAALDVLAHLRDVTAVAGVAAVRDTLLPAVVALAESAEWRVRLAALEHMPAIAAELGAPLFDERLAALCLARLGDSVCAVRDAAIRNLRALTDVFGPAWARRAVVPATLALHTNPVAAHRMSALFAIAALAPALGPDAAADTLLPVVLRLSQDRVPNIRFNAARTLQALVPLLDADTLRSRVRPCLEKLLQDTDPDVKRNARACLDVCPQ